MLYLIQCFIRIKSFKINFFRTFLYIIVILLCKIYTLFNLAPIKTFLLHVWESRKEVNFLSKILYLSNFHYYLRKEGTHWTDQNFTKSDKPFFKDEYQRIKWNDKKHVGQMRLVLAIVRNYKSAENSFVQLNH